MLKQEVCKTFIHRFDSDPRLQNIEGSQDPSITKNTPKERSKGEDYLESGTAGRTVSRTEDSPLPSIGDFLDEPRASGRSIVTYGPSAPRPDPGPAWSRFEVGRFIARMRRECDEGVTPSGWVVYFIADTYDCIKIGTTSNLQRRFKEISKSAGLQCTRAPEKITLIGAFPGDRSTEGYLQRKFEAHRARHEWFHAVPNLISVINALIVPAGYAPFVPLPLSGGVA